MRYKVSIFSFLLLLACLHASAQKPFAEGIITYKVKLQTSDQKEFTGVYIFTIKGSEIKKELKLNNGYQDIVILNCSAGTVYSLQNRNGKKYVVQLKISDLVQKQEKFAGYTIKDEQSNSRQIAGYAAYKGNISYHDGSAADIYYTKEWRPSQTITFERFPDAKFLPMYFSYKDENNITMEFEVDKILPGPVENSVFRIPTDYKMISYEEYKQLSK